MKVSKNCAGIISRYASLDNEKLGKAEEFVNSILGDAEISQGKFDALVSNTYRVGSEKAKSLIEKVKENPNGKFSGLFVENISKEEAAWGKEEVNYFENR
jgi:hypothetical protein